MSPSTNKIVFLSGSTGFIGSRTIQQLCKNGWTVRALVRDTEKAKARFSGWIATTPGNIDIIRGDLFSGPPAERAKLFKECMANASATIHVGEAKSREKDFDAKNIKTFGLLLEAAGEASQMERFVFVSAFMAGGLPQPLPRILTEEMTGIEFPDPYYQWKRMAERLLVRSAEKSRYTYSIIRPALVYGPDAEWLVPMLRIIKRISPFYLPFPNGGRAQLGTVHVEDVAATIAESLSSKHAENQIIHAVDDGGTTFADWIETICNGSSRKVRIGTIPASVVNALAWAADALTPLVNLRLGAELWAQIFCEGCSYSNDKMHQIKGRLKYPTIRDGIPGMMEWFSRTRS